MLRQQIEDFCKAIGLECIGFIKCRRFDELQDFYETRQKLGLQNEFEEKDIEKRISPSHYMAEGKTIISIAFPYYHEDMNKETQGHIKGNNGFSIYTQRADYHRVVKQYLEAVCDYIVSLGGKALSFVDSNTLPERYIAYLAGVGFIGRNNMVITKQYGSYVFLGEIITDLEIDCEDIRNFKELATYAECGECTTCIGECPTKSINKKRCNPNICLSYITQKKEITDGEMGLLKGNIFGCDFCQLKCPYNAQGSIQINVLKDFETLTYMHEDASIYANMDNKYFKEKISQTSCGWRGKNVIRRNAIIHLAHKGEDIEGYKGDSPYINAYIERLKKNLNSLNNKEYRS